MRLLDTDRFALTTSVRCTPRIRCWDLPGHCHAALALSGLEDGSTKLQSQIHVMATWCDGETMLIHLIRVRQRSGHSAGWHAHPQPLG